MQRSLTINGFEINDDSDCYVIAEIGHNHQGSLEKAKEMLRIACECGVNAVKLQKRDNRALFTQALYNMPYAHENSFGQTYGEHREALEFGYDEYVELKKYSIELGLTMFATAFDFSSADFLAKLGVPAFKIASGDLKNTPLIKHVAGMGKPVLISTGGGTLEDVQRAYDAIIPIQSQVSVMQCTAAYPAEPEDMNLKVITTYRENFPNTVIGFSDHQNGIAMSTAAYVLGARIVEKHFTLNHALKGTDHAFSLEPIGLRKLVRDLRRVRLAMGNGIKGKMACESMPLYKMAKKMVAARNLVSGHCLTRADIAIKSPNDGMPPYELENIVGKKLLRDLKEDDNFEYKYLTDVK